MSVAKSLSSRRGCNQLNQLKAFLTTATTWAPISSTRQYIYFFQVSAALSRTGTHTPCVWVPWTACHHRPIFSGFNFSLFICIRIITASKLGLLTAGIRFGVSQGASALQWHCTPELLMFSACGCIWMFKSSGDKVAPYSIPGPGSSIHPRLPSAPAFSGRMRIIAKQCLQVILVLQAPAKPRKHNASLFL